MISTAEAEMAYGYLFLSSTNDPMVLKARNILLCGIGDMPEIKRRAVKRANDAIKRSSMAVLTDEQVARMQGCAGGKCDI